MIRLVCGYRRTGKDTLVKMFNHQEPFKWLVYRSPHNVKPWSITTVKRVSFADNLRSEVNNIYDMEKYKNYDYDELKSVKVLGDKTYRDLLIEHAALRRDQNIDYWVASAADWDNLSDDVMVTDWRYPNEFAYLSLHHPITIRLYRSDISIPDESMISEHQLDNVLTDFLLVNSEDEFDQAIKVFPQYKNYVPYNEGDKCIRSSINWWDDIDHH